ncbi:MAG: hypothetical protein NZM27_06685 [Acetobacteraceae bacterium]|nr:hypothetical protein [Acetobacteraceae bacterium]MDW8399201.1 hypothetical protein [Acetobacteraceae bacterium]
MLLLLALGGVAGVLLLAAFPPEIEPVRVERAIPNERFGGR